MDTYSIFLLSRNLDALMDLLMVLPVLMLTLGALFFCAERYVMRIGGSWQREASPEARRSQARKALKALRTYNVLTVPLSAPDPVAVAESAEAVPETRVACDLPTSLDFEPQNHDARMFTVDTDGSCCIEYDAGRFPLYHEVTFD